MCVALPDIIISNFRGKYPFLNYEDRNSSSGHLFGNGMGLGGWSMRHGAWGRCSERRLCRP